MAIKRIERARPARQASSITLLASLLLLASCAPSDEYIPPPPPTVTVGAPVEQTVTEYAEYTGVTQASASVEIRARVEGYLESIHFKPSARVGEGDLLFVIDPKPFRARLNQAEAELSVQQAQLTLAEAMLKRKEQAFATKAVSEIDLISAQAERDAIKAAVESARAAVETARLEHSYTRITAPISGRIGRELVDVGNLVGAEERTLLATIVQDDPIYAYFTINERDLLRYRTSQSGHWGDPTNGGGRLQVDLGLSDKAGYRFEGWVDFIDNRVDAATGTIQMRGVFPNSDHNLLAGLFARIRLPVAQLEAALLVPDRAVGHDQQGAYVLAVGDKNVVERRSVATGTRVGALRVIESGITLQDRVIVSGLLRARPGLPVSPRSATPPDAGDPEAANP